MHGINASLLELKQVELPEIEKSFFATVDTFDMSSIKYTTWSDYAGEIQETLPVGADVMARITDLDGNVVNTGLSEAAKIKKEVFEYNLRSAEAEEKGAEVVLKNAKIR